MRRKIEKKRENGEKERKDIFPSHPPLPAGEEEKEKYSFWWSSGNH